MPAPTRPLPLSHRAPKHDRWQPPIWPEDLPPATPAAVRAARQAAGLTQAAAADLAFLAARERWAEYEAGSRYIDAARWAWFLARTGQHPAWRLTCRRARGK